MEAFCFRESEERASGRRRNVYSGGWGRQTNMKKQTQSNINETGTPADDKRSMMAAATDMASETMGAARTRLNNAMQKGEELFADLQEASNDRLKAADRTVREHPYRTMIVAAAVGAIVGFLLARDRKHGE